MAEWCFSRMNPALPFTYTLAILLVTGDSVLGTAFWELHPPGTAPSPPLTVYMFSRTRATARATAPLGAAPAEGTEAPAGFRASGVGVMANQELPTATTQTCTHG